MVFREWVNRSLSEQAEDPAVHRHSIRVGLIAEAIGAELGLGEEARASLLIGGSLHDFGKLVIPRSILHAPRRLSERETALIRQHSKLGWNALRDASLHVADRELPIIALEHHERFDGSGYPHGKRGDEICLPARVVVVADVYDALRERRSYKPEMSHEEALRQMTEDGADGLTYPAMFDPVVLDSVRAAGARLGNWWDAADVVAAEWRAED
jgi:HD-GYP domain-containing protein (c-di-GMP phosphodiesterase class II)